MNYEVEVFDRAGVRTARLGEVPLLDIVREGPDGRDRIVGLLPVNAGRFGVGYTVRVRLEGALAATGTVTRSRPAWGEARRLILDRYVNFHELLAFEAEHDAGAGNRRVSRSFQNERADAMVRAAINSALGNVHYTVGHTAYPDGAEREYAKFLVRQAETDALAVGGIDSGQWVDAARIDMSGAYAKDGDTIAGLAVDGEAWPDLRLMLIDCEETSLNSHAIKRHPEIAGWSEAQYNASPYKRRADAAKVRLQQYLDTNGIAFIELNPHRDPSGAFDDRVDVFGRYLGLVYGGGECFNAGLVEEGHADVYLYDEGRYHVPEMALKDFFSYTGPNTDSVAPCDVVVGAFEARGGVLEVLTALAALGGGYVFHVDQDLAVHFRRGDAVDRVVVFDPVETAVELGRDKRGLVNLLRIQGDPLFGGVDGYFAEGDSIDRFGTAYRDFPYYALSQASDAAQLSSGLLQDLAWPRVLGRAIFHRGVTDITPGMLLEFRGEAIAELDADLAGRWGETLQERLVGRVRRVAHRLAGERMTSRLDLTSPYRSVSSPLSFITRSQDSLAAFFQFRLDDGSIGLDTGFHLD
ncbi:MAG: hypothetical protein KF886_05005 [Candidatus Hydrogenedentes bacterium]|nr:hypothetical protein [Candidatus Hydrogenedentota bacterium]